ncbi:hypothetical protein [Bradyrhizobium genosp. A]|uniref:hypothetical protein n=1 Tax=Bradyrhizobium genosp. A TaxID=83626 RepID=UPI003CE72B5B
MIRKLASGEYRLYSRKVNPKTGKRRNLGTFKSRAAAEKHERDVQYFRRHRHLRQVARGTPANQTLENNPMHSSQVADKTADWPKQTARCGFYEISLTRRAKQGHAGIMAEKAPRAALCE